MKLFNINNTKLDFVKENLFKKEREIQSLIEKNIDYIIGLIRQSYDKQMS